jgi:LPS export ABC transporter permease LptG
VRILSRYFLASYLKFFAAVLASSIVAVTVIEMMLHFESVIEHRNGPLGYGTYLLLRVPSYYFRDLLPIASFVAAFCSIGLSARSHEITAIKSGGIYPLRTIIPLLCAASALSGLALLLNESLVLEASRAWSKMQNPGGEITFRQGAFWYYRGNAIYSVQQADQGAKRLYGVSVYELSPQGRLVQVVHSEQVEVEDDGHWRFIDTVSRTFDPTQAGAPPQITRAPEWERDTSAEQALSMVETSAQSLTLAKLAAYIDAQNRSGRTATRYRALYHSRLAGSLTVILFAVLALPLAFAVGQSRSLASSTLHAIATLAAFYTLRTSGEMFSGRGFSWAIPVPWILLAIFGCYGAWGFRKIPR